MPSIAPENVTRPVATAASPYTRARKSSRTDAVIRTALDDRQPSRLIELRSAAGHSGQVLGEEASGGRRVVPLSGGRQLALEPKDLLLRALLLSHGVGTNN